ncbi:MAG: ribonuclease R family protein, partial [Microcoleaceae cyanobacterium]
MEFSIATLLAHFSEDKSIAPKVLEKKLAPDEESIRKFQVALDALERIGLLEKDKGRYRRIEQDGVVEAKLRCSSKGFCFAIQDVEGAEDVYIRESHLSTAWNGDRVLVRVIKEGSRRRSPEGEVYLILERANPSVLARIKQTKTGYRAVPLDDRLLFELELLNDEDELGHAVDHLVHVEVQRYPIGIHRPVGKVVQVLGSDAEEADDLDIVCCKHDLLRSFSERVLLEAEAIPAKPKKTDLKQRTDLRDLFTFSFEPDLGNPEFSGVAQKTDNPARNHVDHAFSLEKLESGDWQIGIHLADPGHYITPDSALDREARKRGISVFLADKLIPIFPELLSCDRLALLPNQERLTISILVTLSAMGKIVEFEIQPSVIQVKQHLSYKQTQGILDDTQTADPDLSSRLEDLLEVSRLVRQLREQRGAFELNLLDTHRHFNDEGELGPMVVAAFSPAHSMIAELVVLANQLIASHLQALGLPAIYRIQPAPDLDDVAELVKLSNHLGCDFELKEEEEIRPIDFQNFVEALSRSRAERVLTYLLEESLKPAVYSTTPKLHFGLSLDCYTHCTSPLSRYT